MYRVWFIVRIQELVGMTFCSKGIFETTDKKSRELIIDIILVLDYSVYLE